MGASPAGKCLLTTMVCILLPRQFTSNKNNLATKMTATSSVWYGYQADLPLMVVLLQKSKIRPRFCTNRIPTSVSDVPIRMGKGINFLKPFRHPGFFTSSQAETPLSALLLRMQSKW